MDDVDVLSQITAVFSLDAVGKPTGLLAAVVSLDPLDEMLVRVAKMSGSLGKVGAKDPFPNASALALAFGALGRRGSTTGKR